MDEQAVKPIRAARAVQGGGEPNTYTCRDCGRILARPLENNALYVLRDDWPRLLCPACVRDTDLYIWGPKEYLDKQDWTEEMLQAEADRQRIEREQAELNQELDGGVK